MCYREGKGIHAISKVEEESSQSNDNGRFFVDDDQQHAPNLYTNNSLFLSLQLPLWYHR
jgi:hypothetical protein